MIVIKDTPLQNKGNILVTGGAGYVGCHACKALAVAGFTPVTLDNLVRGHEWAVKWGPLEVGDVTDARRVADVVKKYRPVGVMHFAAFAYVGESVEHPERYYANNVVGSFQLLQALNRAGIRNIVFSSTCSTYGIPDRIPISEDHQQVPVNPYGTGKLMIETMLRDLDLAYDMPSVSLRYFNAAGADPGGEVGEDHDPETHAVPLAITTALGERPVFEIYGTDYETDDGTAVRDYVHVADLATAHVRALEYLLAGGKRTALNLGTGRGHSVRELIGSVEHVSGKAVAVREGPRRAGDPPVLVADASKAKEILEWQPEYAELDAIVDTALRWHLHRSDAFSAHKRHGGKRTTIK
ncbi:MAG: UDP-glucose 4-epimerase GalE [Acidiferrobacterales bacterium]